MCARTPLSILTSVGWWEQTVARSTTARGVYNTGVPAHNGKFKTRERVAGKLVSVLWYAHVPPTSAGFPLLFCRWWYQYLLPYYTFPFKGRRKHAIFCQANISIVVMVLMLTMISDTWKHFLNIYILSKKHIARDFFHEFAICSKEFEAAG